MLTFLAAAALLACAVCACAAPIALHPQNSRYFVYRERPTILLTSAEHYGAVLNLDFDYRQYLDTLQADGLNHTRTFTGVYCEPAGAFKIARNTLAPEAGRLICPWARSDQPGYPNGGNLFDLSRFDDAYFARLKDFLTLARERGVIVELTLFCPFYGDGQWNLSPMNPANNVNGFGEITAAGAYTLTDHGGLLAVQEALVRKLVTELNEFDNLFYEVMNEPYIKQVPLVWEHHMVDLIVEVEGGLPQRHLISRNVANGKARVDNPHPAVSVFNFHYAWPPETVGMNWRLNRPIGDNETGFAGQADANYRREAWAFLLAGGALFNNLDYSFTAGHEDGSFAYPAEQPGGGSPALRRQLGILRDFLLSFDFIRMAPERSLLQGLPPGLHAEVLARPGEQVAVYVATAGNVAEATAQTAQFRLSLPAGSYRGEWLDPATGATSRAEHFRHEGGEKQLTSPPFTVDVALRVKAQ